MNEGESAISPPRFPDWTEIAPIKDFANQAREATGGIPIGYKLSAQHMKRISMPRWRWGLITSSLMDVAAEPEPLPCSFETIPPYPPFPPWHEPGDISIAWIGKRGDVDHYRRIKNPRRFCKSTRFGSRRYSPLQLRHTGHRMHRNAGLPY